MQFSFTQSKNPGIEPSSSRILSFPWPGLVQVPQSGSEDSWTKFNIKIELKISSGESVWHGNKLCLIVHLRSFKIFKGPRKNWKNLWGSFCSGSFIGYYFGPFWKWFIECQSWHIRKKGLRLWRQVQNFQFCLAIKNWKEIPRLLSDKWDLFQLDDLSWPWVTFWPWPEFRRISKFSFSRLSFFEGKSHTNSWIFTNSPCI